MKCNEVKYGWKGRRESLCLGEQRQWLSANQMKQVAFWPTDKVNQHPPTQPPVKVYHPQQHPPTLPPVKVDQPHHYQHRSISSEFGSFHNQSIHSKDVKWFVANWTPGPNYLFFGGNLPRAHLITTGCWQMGTDYPKPNLPWTVYIKGSGFNSK